jgi:hypothetical protein
MMKVCIVVLCGVLAICTLRANEPVPAETIKAGEYKKQYDQARQALVDQLFDELRSGQRKGTVKDAQAEADKLVLETFGKRFKGKVIAVTGVADWGQKYRARFAEDTIICNLAQGEFITEKGKLYGTGAAEIPPGATVTLIGEVRFYPDRSTGTMPPLLLENCKLKIGSVVPKK